MRTRNRHAMIVEILWEVDCKGNLQEIRKAAEDEAKRAIKMHQKCTKIFPIHAYCNKQDDSYNVISSLVDRDLRSHRDLRSNLKSDWGSKGRKFKSCRPDFT
ncbi:hypothetical protein Pr1d_30870 [Bythopirellula goksoeyrii]|uniref:Uncharacterized protein n=1 Tax=Bythopirellula goksoeyrii TaxID=1400387 RepID=A0A5B9QNU2_9BACT|nr:hypothetical protein Pr1d_30870 [Bythopirellula goksoeyrii]